MGTSKKEEKVNGITHSFSSKNNIQTLSARLDGGKIILIGFINAGNHKIGKNFNHNGTMKVLEGSITFKGLEYITGATLTFAINDSMDLLANKTSAVYIEIFHAIIKK